MECSNTTLSIEQVERVFETQMGGIGGQAGVMAAVQARLARRQLPRINSEGLVEHANPVPTLSTASTASHRPSVTGPDIDWILAAPGTAAPSSLSGSIECNGSAISTPSRLPSMNPVSAGPTPRRYCSAGKNRLPWEPDGAKEGKQPASASLAHVKAKENAKLPPPPPIKAKKSWHDKEQADEGSKISLSAAVGSASPGSYAELHKSKLKRSTGALSDSAVTSSVSLQSSCSTRAGRELSPLVTDAGKLRLSFPSREDKPPLPPGLKAMATVPSVSTFFPSLKQQEKQLLLGDSNNLSLSWPRQRALGSAHGRDEQTVLESQHVNPLPFKPALARPGSKKKKVNESPKPKRAKSRSRSPPDESKQTAMKKHTVQGRNESPLSSSSDSWGPSDSEQMTAKVKRGTNGERARKPELVGRLDMAGDVVCQRPVIARAVRTPRNKRVEVGDEKVMKKSELSRLPGPVKMERRATEQAAIVLTQHDPVSHEPPPPRQARSETPERKVESYDGHAVLSESVMKKVCEQSSSQRAEKVLVDRSNDSRHDNSRTHGSSRAIDQLLPKSSSSYPTPSLKTVNDRDSASGHVREEMRSVGVVNDPVLAESTKKKAEELKQSSRQSLDDMLDGRSNTQERQSRSTKSRGKTADEGNTKNRQTGNRKNGSNVAMAAVFPRSRMPQDKERGVAMFETLGRYSEAGNVHSNPLSLVSNGFTENTSGSDSSVTGSSDDLSSTGSNRSLEMDRAIEHRHAPSDETVTSTQMLQKRAALKAASRKHSNENETSLSGSRDLPAVQAATETSLVSIPNTEGVYSASSLDSRLELSHHPANKFSSGDENRHLASVHNAKDPVKNQTRLHEAAVNGRVQRDDTIPVRGLSGDKHVDDENSVNVVNRERGRQAARSHQSQQKTPLVETDAADEKLDGTSCQSVGSRNAEISDETRTVGRNDKVVVGGHGGEHERMISVRKQLSVERKEARGDVRNSGNTAAKDVVTTGGRQSFQHGYGDSGESDISGRNEGNANHNGAQQEVEDSTPGSSSLDHVENKRVLAASLLDRIQSRDKARRSVKRLPTEKEAQRPDVVGQLNSSDVAVVGRGVQLQGMVAMKRQSSVETLKREVDGLDNSASTVAAETEETVKSPIERSLSSHSSSPEEGSVNQFPTISNPKLSASLTRKLTSRDKPPLNVRHRQSYSEELELPDTAGTSGGKRAPDHDSTARESPQTVLNPDTALRDALRYSMSDDWEVKCEGIALFRRLTAHHPEVLHAQLKSVIVAVVQEVKNLRSQVSRAAIQCLGELYTSLGRAMDLDLDITVRVLLNKGGESSGFIRQDVDRALNEMVGGVTPSRAVLALTASGVSHRNVAVRKMTAQIVYNLVELAGIEQVVRNGREMLDRILPAAVQFTLDGSPETRYLGRAIINLLVDHADFERLGPKVLSDKLQRQLQGVVDGLRMKGLGELPSDKPSAKRKRSFTNPASGDSSRVASRESRASEQSSRSFQRRLSTGQERNGVSKSSLPQSHDSHHGAFPTSLLKRMASSEWRERYEAVTELMHLAVSSPTLVGSNIVRVFDQLVPRLTDSNSKVNVYSLQCFEVMLPRMAPYLESVIGILIPAVSCNLASKNPTIQQSAASIIDHIMAVVDNSVLVQPFSSVVQFGNAKAKPIMTEKLATLVDTVYSHHRKLVARHVLPVIWHLVSSAQGGKTLTAMNGESRLAACKLVHIVFDHMGQTLLEQARHLPPRQQGTLQSLLDTFGPSHD